jgi:hypothetical protein
LRISRRARQPANIEERLMSISRRKFIRLGTIAAIAAGISIRPSLIALAQDVVDKAGGTTVTDPLANYTQSTFAQYVNSIFRLRGFTTVDVTLVKVEDTLPAKVSRAGGRESFALFFRGGSIKLPQDTYIVEHAALGTFRLFLVPSGADENGAQGYVAIINRLPYGTKPALPRTQRKPVETKKSINPSSGTKSPATQPPQKPTRKGKDDPERFEESGITS